MSPREVVQEALAFRHPPYVPWSFRFTREAREKLERHFGTTDLDPYIGNHLLELGSDIGFFTDLGDNRHQDVFGVIWNRSIDKDIGVVEGQVLPEPTLEGFQFPDPLGTIADYNIAQVRKAMEYDIDAVYFGDDWGQQQGLLMGYPFWKEFIYPQIKRMYGVVREAGKTVFIHSCGDVDEVFEELVSIGLGVFNPFQPEVMDVSGLLNKYRGKLAFWGASLPSAPCLTALPKRSARRFAKCASLGAMAGISFPHPMRWKVISRSRRIPIPSEENVRTVRQLPLEIDPPAHRDYRAVAEPFFNRARLPEVIGKVETLVRTLLAEALKRDSIEIVREFVIPLQSRALAILLNMPESEAEIWISWGTHVFREGDGGQKGAALETYLNQLFDRALAEPGDDFFSALTQSTFRGRSLTREELLGYGSITFAGGRDTIINSIPGVLGHLADRPADLEFLREDPKRIMHATEEFFRVISPVTHIGRVCPGGAELNGVTVSSGALVSLCFASANHDEAMFDKPEEVRMDRKPNPHVAFGFGTHLSLGAAHARLIVRSLLKCVCEEVAGITRLAAQEKNEREASYHRKLAFDSLVLRFSKR